MAPDAPQVGSGPAKKQLHQKTHRDESPVTENKNIKAT
jgi:hypothetical protein